MRRTLDSKRSIARRSEFNALPTAMIWDQFRVNARRHPRRRRPLPLLLEALEVRELLWADVNVFPVPGNPMAIVAGLDGNLWFTEQGTPDQIGRLSTSGSLTEFPLTSNKSVTGIAAGPDGNLWFIQPGNGEVGRITTGGAVTEFPLPSAGYQPTAIASGPDGNIWVAEFDRLSQYTGQFQIARITPAGDFTEFAVPPPSFNGFATVTTTITTLAAGPDGDLWFGSSAPGFIGEITTSGTVSLIPLISVTPFGFTSVVTSIATGTNGDLWFVATADGLDSTEAVGHISAGGLIAGFASQQLDEGNVVVGPDGNLWITQATVFIPARVERSTPSGSLSTFTTQLNVNYAKDFPLSTVAITTGPDGNLWITEAPSAQPGSSSVSTFDVVQLIVAKSTPDGTGKMPSAKHKKPANHPHPKPKPKHPKPAPLRGHAPPQKSRAR